MENFGAFCILKFLAFNCPIALQKKMIISSHFKNLYRILRDLTRFEFLDKINF